LTGSKNAVKGLGFFLGAALLALAGFEAAVLGLAGGLLAVLVAVAVLMPPGLPAGRKGARFREVVSKDANVNRLSAARMFLFGARDVWFVVGIPVYFYGVVSDGTPEGGRAAFFLVGSFMAIWIVFYGAVQAAAPRLLTSAATSLSAATRAARFWAGVLALIPAALALCAAVGGAVEPPHWLTGTLTAGLLGFGVVFALNSALHSYLILAFTTAERVTMDVGFYYMSNAAGRLLGTLLSGLSYQAGGLALCLATAAAMAAGSWLCAIPLARGSVARRSETAG
ncbi:MAG: MFS transporter, partial [Thermohalobaculum sp.]|nr:MFS transporter [Thermohalobaculum sp.]